MKPIIYMCVMICLAGCGYDNFRDIDPQTPNIPAITKSLPEVVSLYGETPFEVTSPIVTSGVVISSDEENNFFKTIVIQSGNSAIEIVAGLYNLHNIFPIGSEVVISLKGLVLSKSYGIIRTGLKTTFNNKLSIKEFGYIALLNQYLNVNRTKIDIEPYRGVLKKELCGILVEVSDLKAVNYNEPYLICEDNIAVYISPYALFSATDISSEIFSACGILQYGNISGKDMFILKPRYAHDLHY